MSEKDRQTIEKLLDQLAQHSELKFVRADKIYNASTAAWYMRFKWNNNEDKVKSVDDFIALQSTGGEKGDIIYYVQFPDGSRKPAREVMEGFMKDAAK